MPLMCSTKLYLSLAVNVSDGKNVVIFFGRCEEMCICTSIAKVGNQVLILLLDLFWVIHIERLLLRLKWLLQLH